jgi:hypothetical protein
MDSGTTERSKRLIAVVVLPLARETGLDRVKLQTKFMLSKSGRSDADGTGRKNSLIYMPAKVSIRDRTKTRRAAEHAERKAAGTDDV